MRPTNLETEVFISAAFFRAQHSDSSSTVMVIFFNTNTLCHELPARHSSLDEPSFAGSAADVTWMEQRFTMMGKGAR